MPVAIKEHDTTTSHLLRMHPTFSKSVRPLVLLLRYQNRVIPTSFSLQLALKSAGSITVLRSVADAGTAAGVICSIAGDVLVLQRDNAPKHCTHHTVELLCHETHRSLIVIWYQPTLQT